MPKVSIVLPTYKGYRYLRQSIQSCLDQSFTDFELIIIDDGPSQETQDIVNSFSDKRIKLLINEHNIGLPDSVNKGMSNAIGRYLTWTSDDNYFAKDAIKEMVTYLDENKSYFVYCNYWLINEEGEKIKEVKLSNPENLDGFNTIGACFLYKKEIPEKIGGFNKEFLGAEDYEYWLRIKYSGFKISKIDKTLYYYRQNPQGITGTQKSIGLAQKAYLACKAHCPAWSQLINLGKVELYSNRPLSAIKYFLQSIMQKPNFFYTWKLIVFAIINIISPKFAQNLKNKI
ncbi:MAG TPA: glycosyltransferase [Candidatus Pacearchaeota archaeon]|nr:glycosyltransferase [Candidatus Pacearchaeota archaeon]HQI74537.1 glycosyltransferase [Candidatus Pacearchaeota archaeon]